MAIRVVLPDETPVADWAWFNRQVGLDPLFEAP